MIRLKLSLAVLIAVFLMFPAIVQAQAGTACGTQVSVAPTTAQEDQPVKVTIDFHNCSGRMGLVQITVDVKPTVSKCAAFAETFWVGGQVFPDKTSVFTHTFPAPKCASTYNLSFNDVVRATLTVVPVTTTSLTVKVTSPMNNSTVTNPVHIAATASGPNPISQIQIWVNFKEVFHVIGGTLNTNLTLPVGSDERFVVQAVDSKGNVAKVVDSITVRATGPPPAGTLTGYCFGRVTPFQCALVQDLTDCPVGKKAVHPTDVSGCLPGTSRFVDTSTSCHGITKTGLTVKGQCVVAQQ